MKLIFRRLRNYYYQRHLRRKDLPEVIRNHLQGFHEFNFSKPITETEFVVFDIETTGLNARGGDRIICISAVRLREGRIDLSDAFHEIINPNRDIPPTSAVIHEILPRMVNGKPTIEKVLPDFIKYIGISVLVAHHGWLDMSFLNREMARLYGIPIQNIVLDTAVLDQALLAKKAPASMTDATKINSTLDAVAERYHVAVEELHSSFWDALATAQIFQQMIKAFQGLGILSLKDFLKLAHTPPSLGVVQPDHFSA
ncbi:MAG TPA: 3'-5' exonuclease [Thermodesulfobacteriota bacterium]|nr:3'-5' exonuclease [Thermodesulfobacteriota bacterium]